MNQIKTILIIEDNEVMRQSLVESLKNSWLNVFESNSGEEGLKIALQEHPDLILLDLIVKEMSGMNFLKQLRQDDWGKTASVVVLTNLDDPEIKSEAENFEISDFLIKKDWPLPDLAIRIKKKLGLH
ncbi:MAG: response regulator [Candidatus Sungbacteria bacterium]|nr:response regulator [Candidatus Sungbacteria bacterium]